MGHTEYKFEKFIQPQFPIYASVQSGREELVENHHHSTAEIMQVLDGRVKMLIGTVYRECEKGDIVFEHVDSKNQLADIFTKPLATDPFIFIRGELGILDISNLE